MVLTDTFITKRAESLDGVAVTIPAYLAVATTEIASIATSATELEGEVGTRGALSRSRSGFTVSYSAVRSGAVVIDTANGDSLNSSGLFDSLTNGDFEAGVTHTGILQQTSYDLEFNYDVISGRG